jgi:hypothetical protein
MVAGVWFTLSATGWKGEIVEDDFIPATFVVWRRSCN